MSDKKYAVWEGELSRIVDSKEEAVAAIGDSDHAVVLEYQVVGDDEYKILKAHSGEDWLIREKLSRSLPVLALARKDKGWEVMLGVGYGFYRFNALPCQMYMRIPGLQEVREEEMYILRKDDPDVLLEFGIDLSNDRFRRLVIHD